MRVTLALRRNGAMKKKQAVPKSKLETQYEELFRQLQTTWVVPHENSSLAQPTPLKVLPSVVTYGAYEEPIFG